MISFKRFLLLSLLGAVFWNGAAADSARIFIVCSAQRIKAKEYRITRIIGETEDSKSI